MNELLININSYGVFAGLLTVVFFLITLSIYAIIFERTKVMRNIIIYEILMMLNLATILILVNLREPEWIFIFSRLVFVWYVLFASTFVILINQSRKKPVKSINYASILVFCLMMFALLSNDQWLVTRSIAGRTFLHAVAGPYYKYCIVFNIIAILWVMYDWISRLIKKDSTLKKYWLFHSAFLIHAVSNIIFGRLLMARIIFKIPVFFSSISFNIVLIVYLFNSIRSEVKLNDLLHEAYIYDDLTKVYTREYIIESLASKLEDDKQKHAVVMIDIDKFKAINDTYGHVLGDKILEGLGAILMGSEQDNISAGRLGGDEFILLFTDYTLVQVKQHLRAVINNYQELLYEVLKEKAACNSGLSMGLMKLKPHSSVTHVLESVDMSMYIAKRKGINKIEVV